LTHRLFCYSTRRTRSMRPKTDVRARRSRLAFKRFLGGSSFMRTPAVFQSTALVLLLSLAIAGCHRQLPVLSPVLDKDLTSAKPFEKAPLVVQPPLDLERLPLEPSSDIINRAKQETAPRSEEHTSELQSRRD